MGISIHYIGRLKAKNYLPKLIEEVKDIAKIHNWPYHAFDEEFPAGSFNKSSFNRHIYGICFTPPGCETVSLTFLSNGKLVDQWVWQHYHSTKEKDKKMLEGISAKTHYAGTHTHKILIHLFDYLSKKYFRHFKLIDEGQYWETRDEKLLDNNFKHLNALMGSFGAALESLPVKRGETFEKYFERLLNQMQQDKMKN